MAPVSSWMRVGSHSGNSRGRSPRGLNPAGHLLPKNCLVQEGERERPDGPQPLGLMVQTMSHPQSYWIGEEKHLFIRQLLVWQLTWGAWKALKINPSMAASSAVETFVGWGCRWGRIFWDRLAWDTGSLDATGRVSAIREVIWEGCPRGEDKAREKEGSTSSDCEIWPKPSGKYTIANGPRETSKIWAGQNALCSCSSSEAVPMNLCSLRQSFPLPKSCPYVSWSLLGQEKESRIVPITNRVVISTWCGAQEAKWAGEWGHVGSEDRAYEHYTHTTKIGYLCWTSQGVTIAMVVKEMAG